MNRVVTKNAVVFDIDLTLIHSQELKFNELKFYKANGIKIINYDEHDRKLEHLLTKRDDGLMDGSQGSRQPYNIDKYGIIFVKCNLIYYVHFRPNLRKLFAKLMKLKTVAKDDIVIIAATMAQKWYARIIVDLFETFFVHKSSNFTIEELNKGTENKLFDDLYSNDSWKHVYNNIKIKNVDHILDELHSQFAEKEMRKKIENEALRVNKIDEEERLLFINSVHIFDDQINIWYFNQEKQEEYGTIVRPYQVVGWDYNCIDDEQLIHVNRYIDEKLFMHYLNGRVDLVNTNILNRPDKKSIETFSQLADDDLDDEDDEDEDDDEDDDLYDYDNELNDNFVLDSSLRMDSIKTDSSISELQTPRTPGTPALLCTSSSGSLLSNASANAKKSPRIFGNQPVDLNKAKSLRISIEKSSAATLDLEAVSKKKVVFGTPHSFSYQCLPFSRSSENLNVSKSTRSYHSPNEGSCFKFPEFHSSLKSYGSKQYAYTPNIQHQKQQHDQLLHRLQNTKTSHSPLLRKTQSEEIITKQDESKTNKKKSKLFSLNENLNCDVRTVASSMTSSAYRNDSIEQTSKSKMMSKEQYNGLMERSLHHLLSGCDKVNAKPKVVYNNNGKQAGIVLHVADTDELIKNPGVKITLLK